MSRRDEVCDREDALLEILLDYMRDCGADCQDTAGTLIKIRALFPEALPIPTAEAQGIAQSIKDVTDNIDIANAGSHK